MKGLMKASYGGSAMWREWRMTKLLKGFIYRSMVVVAQWVGCRRGGLTL